MNIAAEVARRRAESDDGYQSVSPDMRAVLETIMRHDPDGGMVEPTEEAYRSFERWAVANYGEEAWVAYLVGGWSLPPEV